MTVETSDTQGNVETTATQNTGVASPEIQEWQAEPNETEQVEQTEQVEMPDSKVEPEKPKRSRAQERIEHLARENAELKRKQADYEAAQQKQDIQRPSIEAFESYAAYEDALEEYHIAKAEERVLAKLNQRDSEQSEVEKRNAMQSAIDQFADQHQDFDEVVQAGLKRPLPMSITLDELADEFGYDQQTQVRLLYEIAKDQAFHESVSHASKLKAARLLSERVDTWAKPVTPLVSKAPPPIKPVQANAPVIRDAAKMSDDEWYKAEINKRKGK
ncbi:hypothetical protein [Acinetobacter sp. Marseille-Q1618]|uniref:hypothetical protein n=1 Tax=Acinetobacter sp. Marseille-Q1618 TaxID=2697502 RepID=UPI00156FD8EF|nr:hypothetical protein [Acinetobacter sp. Marseille-Q1618]